jgi:hypothetical protein
MATREPILNNQQSHHQPSMRTFYQKLTLRDPHDFRLLMLQPGRENDPVQCTLVRASLDDNPGYEALSYEWHALAGGETITCCDTRFPVTYNLFSALSSLRHTNRPRRLWIDAICINQEDPKERNQQVALMTKIYTCAEQVLAWLGPSRCRTDEAFKTMGLLANLWAQRAEAGMRENNYPKYVVKSKSELDQRTIFDSSKAMHWFSPRSMMLNGPIKITR